MNILKIGTIALTMLAAAQASHAASVGYSEGSRAQVAGTIDLGDVSPNPAGAFDLLSNDGGALGGDFGTGDSIEIYGRIVGSIDNYAFELVATSSFVVEFIFGGYTLESGGSVSDSGFISETVAEKTATFKLTDTSDNSMLSKVYTTDISGPGDNGGTATIFSGGPGSYVFAVDGTGDQGRPVGLYDVRISAVPLPASALLMIAGLGGLGAVARRKRS